MSKRQVIMALALIVLLGIAATGFNAWSAYAQGPSTGGNAPCGNNPQGSGMMGGHRMGHMSGGYGRGMMGGGMMDDCPYADDADHDFGMMGNGMMGGMMGRMMNGMGWADVNGSMMETWTPPQELAPASGTLTQDEAVKVAEAYVASLNNDTLALGEVTLFHNYFHAFVTEKASGNILFGFMINPTTGQIWSHHAQNQAAGTSS